jgi:hypothetical protein
MRNVHASEIAERQRLEKPSQLRNCSWWCDSVHKYALHLLADRTQPRVRRAHGGKLLAPGVLRTLRQAVPEGVAREPGCACLLQYT